MISLECLSCFGLQGICDNPVNGYTTATMLEIRVTQLQVLVAAGHAKPNVESYGGFCDYF